MSDNMALSTADFQQADSLDEQMILDELEGAVLDTYVYQFSVKDKKSGSGHTVTGLSWAGVKAVATKMSGVQLDMVQLQAEPERYICVMKATWTKDGSSRYGAAEQARMANNYPDPFALPKAMSKAQRNAMRALFPDTLVSEVVKMALEAKQVRVVERQPPARLAQANGGLSTEQRAALDDVFTYGARLSLGRETIIDVLKAGGFEARRDLPIKRDAMLAALDEYAAQQAQPAVQEQVA